MKKRKSPRGPNQKPTSKKGAQKKKPSRAKCSVIVNEIRENYMLSVITGIDSMKHFIAAGEAAIRLKKLVGHGKFIEIVKKEIPHICLRQVQRAMKLSEAYDFSNYEALYLPPKSHLEKIIKNAGKTGVMDFLEENEINLNFNPEEVQELDNYLEAFKNLANKKSPQKSRVKNDLENTGDWGEGQDEAEEKPDPKTPAEVADIITTKAIYYWAKSIHQSYKKSEKKFSPKRTARIKKLISAFKRLVDDYGAEENEGDPSDSE